MPGLPFTFMRDFLRVFLELTVCRLWPHTLLIFSLMPFTYDRNTQSATSRNFSPLHLLSQFSSSLLTWNSRSPHEYSWHAPIRLQEQTPVCRSVQVCSGGSLYTIFNLTSPLDGGVSCSECSVGAWTSYKHWWSVCFHPSYMDIEERNWSFNISLHSELDCTLTIQMFKKAL